MFVLVGWGRHEGFQMLRRMHEESSGIEVVCAATIHDQLLGQVRVRMHKHTFVCTIVRGHAHRSVCACTHVHIEIIGQVRSWLLQGHSTAEIQAELDRQFLEMFALDAADALDSKHKWIGKLDWINKWGGTPRL